MYYDNDDNISNRDLYHRDRKKYMDHNITREDYYKGTRSSVRGNYCENDKNNRSYRENYQRRNEREVVRDTEKRWSHS